MARRSPRERRPFSSICRSDRLRHPRPCCRSVPPQAIEVRGNRPRGGVDLANRLGHDGRAAIHSSLAPTAPGPRDRPCEDTRGGCTGNGTVTPPSGGQSYLAVSTRDRRRLSSDAKASAWCWRVREGRSAAGSSTSPARRRTSRARTNRRRRKKVPGRAEPWASFERWTATPRRRSEPGRGALRAGTPRLTHRESRRPVTAPRRCQRPLAIDPLRPLRTSPAGSRSVRSEAPPVRQCEFDEALGRVLEGIRVPRTG